MIHPTPRFLAFLAIGFLPAAMPAIAGGSLWGLWAAWIGSAALVLAADAALLVRSRTLSVRLDHTAMIHVGHEGEARCSVSSAERAVTVDLLPELDDLLLPQPVFRLVIPAGGSAEGGFTLSPRRRGRLALRALWLRWSGPLGLARRVERRPLDVTVSVVPDVTAARDAAIRFFGSRRAEGGNRIERFLGEGTEFESLREFVPGFDPRALSWKSSARHRRLLVRQYRAERNHQIVVALDTGRLMSEPMEGLPRIDHAVTASILLAFIATKTGDRIGLHAFDSAARMHLPPGGGAAAFQRMLRKSAEVEYSTAETNYTLGLTDLLTRLRRRSLVVVFTEFIDSTTAELMVDNIGRLAKNHLVIFVALKDAGLAAISRARPDSVDGMHRAVVASNLLKERALVLARLRRMGVHCIDAPPAEFSTELLNRYLDIRRRELV